MKEYSRRLINGLAYESLTASVIGGVFCISAILHDGAARPFLIGLVTMLLIMGAVLFLQRCSLLRPNGFSRLVRESEKNNQGRQDHEDRYEGEREGP